MATSSPVNIISWQHHFVATSSRGNIISWQHHLVATSSRGNIISWQHHLLMATSSPVNIISWQHHLVATSSRGNIISWQHRLVATSSRGNIVSWQHHLLMATSSRGNIMSRQHYPKSHVDIRYRWAVDVRTREYLYARFLKFYIKHRQSILLSWRHHLVATLGTDGQLIRFLVRKCRVVGVWAVKAMFSDNPSWRLVQAYGLQSPYTNYFALSRTRKHRRVEWKRQKLVFLRLATLQNASLKKNQP